MAINGECYLLDVFWACTCVEDNPLSDWIYLWNFFDKEVQESGDQGANQELDKKEDGRTKHRVNEFFFLTDPEEFIFTHCPRERRWQLLKNPIDENKFEKQACLQERFHKLGLVIPDNIPKECIIQTKSGKASFEFRASHACMSSLRFRWKITRRKQEGENLAASSFDRYIFYQKTGDKVTFELEFPMAGTYQMDLYGQEGGEEGFDKVCSYCVLCDEATSQAEPLPDVPDIGWGTCPEADKMKLRPLFEGSGPYIDSADGELQLKFSAPEGAMVGFTLRHNVIRNAVLRKHALLTRSGQEVVVTLRLPAKGNYALGLYVEDPSEKEMHNVCNYLVRCQAVGVGSKPFPMLHGGIVGESLLAKILGVHPETQGSAVLNTEDGNVQVAFEVTNPGQVDLLCELQHNKIEGSKLVNSIQCTKEGNLVTYDLALPLAGEYAFNVYAKKSGTDYQIYHLFTYMIVAAKGTGVPIKTSIQDMDIDTIFTADDLVDIRVMQSKGSLLVVTRNNAPDQLVEDQITAKKEGDITVFEVELPKTGEYIAAVFRLKQGHLIMNQLTQVVRLEPLERDSRPTDVSDSMCVIIISTLDILKIFISVNFRSILLIQV